MQSLATRNILQSIVTLILIVSIECNENITMRIVGGTQIKIQDFPYFAALEVKGCNSGAGIISRQWLLTVVACIVGNNGRRLPSTNAKVRAGIDHINAKDAQIARVEKLIPHPDYSRAEMNNDIALVKLAEPLNFTSKVQKLRLPQRGEEKKYAGLIRKAKIAGFGSTHKQRDYPKNDRLWELDVTIWRDDQCKEFASSAEQKICTGDLTGERSPCYGDWGSPLVFHTKTGPVILGLASYGLESKTCTSSEYPGIHTRVSYYLEWIMKTILEN